MSIFTADVRAGRRNVALGITLFLVLGVLVGIPLTIDFFGGSIFGAEEYQTVKVVHAYGVFLAFVNYFFGLMVDRLTLSDRQKELASWSFAIAGLVGGLVRLPLVAAGALDDYGLYVSLVETVCFVAGTALVLAGQAAGRTTRTSAELVVPGGR
jgi:hypothetical protein